MVFAPLQAPPLSEALHDRYRAHGVDLRLERDRDPGRRPRRRRASASSRTSSSPAPPASRCGAASSSTSGSRPSRPGVYAIGDVAEFFDPLYRRHRRIEHWSNAAYHGTTLGQILAGEDARYDIVSAFFSEEFGKSFKVLRRRGRPRLDVARGRLRRGFAPCSASSQGGARHRRRLSPDQDEEDEDGAEGRRSEPAQPPSA